MIQVNTTLSCFIDTEEETTFIYINLINENMFSMTLEYADITDSFNDYARVNDHFSIYDDIKEFKSDLEKGYLERFMGQPRDNARLDLMINLKMKMNHQDGRCEDSCILCNPDMGEDLFPDFTFDIRNADPKGEA
jgi:hypothetical protein